VAAPGCSRRLTTVVGGATERTHSWHNRLRKLRIRYEQHAVNYRGLVEFACSLIVYRLCSFLG